MTKCEERIQEKLNRMGNVVRSDDLSDLDPKTVREYLMIMWPTQRAMLKHLERLNDFKGNISGRVRFLEAAWKIAGAVFLIYFLGKILGW